MISQKDPSPTPAESQRAIVETHLDAALADLAAATGGSNVCQITKDGRVTGGLKHAEGRLIAVRSLARRLGEAPLLPDDLARERAIWQALYDRHSAKAQPSIPWLAYAQGGLDAVDLLAVALGFDTVA